MSVYSLELSYVIMTVISHCKITVHFQTIPGEINIRKICYEIITKILLVFKVRFPAASSTSTLFFYGKWWDWKPVCNERRGWRKENFLELLFQPGGTKHFIHSHQPPKLSVLFLQMLETHGQFQSQLEEFQSEAIPLISLETFEWFKSKRNHINIFAMKILCIGVFPGAFAGFPERLGQSMGSRKEDRN